MDTHLRIGGIFLATQNKYGLGFSPLSMKNAVIHGFIEEMVANKELGMFGLVMDDDKNIVSHEYLVRCKAQLDAFVNYLIQAQTLGKIYKLSVADYFGTLITNNSTNLIGDADQVSIDCRTTKPSSLRFSFGIEVFEKDTCGLVHFNEITVDIGLTVHVGTESNKFTISAPILQLNSGGYDIKYGSIPAETPGNVSIDIDSVIIKPPGEFDYNTYKIALYDILIAVI